VYLAFPNQPALANLAHNCIRRGRFSLSSAATDAHMHPDRLLALLRSFEDVFRVDGTSVALAVEGFKARARKATTTGLLFGELPPPVGFVDGVFPIRPGAGWWWWWWGRAGVGWRTCQDSLAACRRPLSLPRGL
jgi:hypothetical protein